MKKGTLLIAVLFSCFAVFGQSHFSPNWSGGGLDVMTFTITQATINGVDMLAGDEIAVFDGSECVGVSLLTGVISGGASLQILASRDDDVTPETDGYTVGNSYTFRVWDQSESREVFGVSQTLNSGSSTFQLSGTASLTLVATYVVPNTAPVVTGIPDQVVGSCGTFLTINLDDYVDDAETADADILWSISGSADLEVSISSRVATITLPYPNWYGDENISFTATDDDLTDPLSDSDEASFSVARMAEPGVGTPTQPDCDVATGSVDLTGLPAGDWTLTRSPDASTTNGSGTTTTINNLAEGTYSFTVTNSDGCTSSASADVVINAQPATPSAPVTGTPTQPDCDVATGSVELTGLPAGDWTLTRYPGGINTSGSGTTTLISGLAEGTYTYTITNSYGCNSVGSSEVIINAQPPTPAAPVIGAVTQPDCGTATGSIQWTGLPTGNWILTRFPGGSTISGSGGSYRISGLYPDAYNYTVTNSVGCVSDVSQTAVINLQPETPDAPVVGTISQPTCSSRTGSVVLSGLPESDTWTLVMSPGGNEISGTGSVSIVSGLYPGTYTFTVRNISGCTSLASATIVVNSQPDTPSNPVSLPAYLTGCEGESIPLDPGLGFETYTWSTGQTSQVINVTTSGNYTVTVTEGDCSASASSSVTINEIPSLELGNDISSCAGESVILDAGAGQDSYYWSTGANSRTIEVSQDGNYGVTITLNGCSNSDNISVRFYDRPIIPLYSSYYNTDCISLDAGNPGSTYSWSTTETTSSIFACSSSTYTVTVTNENNCSSWAEINVTIGDKPVVDLPESLSACQGEFLKLDAGGGFSSYLWNTGETTQSINVSASGTYSVTVKDTYGEEADDDVEVTFRSLPTVDLGSDQSVCQGESAELDAGADFISYLWSTGETTRSISVTTSGTLGITVNDGFCSGSDDVNVQVIALPQLDLGPDINACIYEDVILNAGAGFDTYDWSTGETSASITVSAPGIYSVTLTENGCVASDEIEVAYVSPPEVELGPDITSCAGEDVILNAGSGFDAYQWNSGENTQSVSVSTTGSYTVTVSSGNCSASDIVLVTFNPLPPLDMDPTLLVCGDEVGILDAGSGFVDYLWSTGATSQTISVLSSGDYSVRVSDGNCSAEDMVTVTFSDMPEIELGSSISTCDGELFILDAGPGFDVYLWNTGESTQQIKVTSPGNYIVSVSNMCGATTDDITVTFIELPEVDLGIDMTINVSDDLMLDAGAGFSSYLWSTGDTKKEILRSGLSPGVYEYWVRVKGDTRCSNSDTILVTVLLGNAVEYASLDQKLNLFPNPAGDRIYIESDGRINSDIVISIYDGTGKLLLLEKWDELLQNQSREIDVSEFHGGIYFVRFSSDEELAYRKLIIKR